MNVYPLYSRCLHMRIVIHLINGFDIILAGHLIIINLLHVNSGPQSNEIAGQRLGK